MLLGGNMAKSLTEVASLARSHTETALRVLIGIATHPKAPASARVAAAEAILSRGWGKPAQSVEVAGPDQGPIQVESPRDTIEARLAAISARLSAHDDQDPEETRH